MWKEDTGRLPCKHDKHDPTTPPCSLFARAHLLVLAACSQTMLNWLARKHFAPLMLPNPVCRWSPSPFVQPGSASKHGETVLLESLSWKFIVFIVAPGRRPESSGSISLSVSNFRSKICKSPRQLVVCPMPVWAREPTGSWKASTPRLPEGLLFRGVLTCFG